MTAIAVIGQGKLGFPVAAYYAQAGAEVVGVDIAEAVVRDINSGRSPIGFEPGASDQVSELVASGRLTATTIAAEAIATADVVIVLVPLYASDGHLDFTGLEGVVASIGEHVRSDALVIIETTLPIGATRNRFLSRLRARADTVRVAFSPERVSSGRVWKDLDTYPKLVGGVDAASADAAAAFYRAHLRADVVVMTNAETAEMTKLAETTYRDLNIAFANELAKFADDWSIDIGEVIDGANSQPYSHIHRPGAGVGGHCIPHNPHFLQYSTAGSELVTLARGINESMPAWVLERVRREIGPLTDRVVVLRGVAYRAGVKESSGSPAFGLRDAFIKAGAVVFAEDPCFSAQELAGLGFKPWDGESAAIVIVVTDHLEYLDVDWSSISPALIVDGRNALDRDSVRAAGHRYVGIGRT